MRSQHTAVMGVLCNVVSPAADVKHHSRADDKFRDRFLWGRRPMLAAVAARLPKQRDNVWIDLGGGTGVRFLLPRWPAKFPIMNLQPFHCSCGAGERADDGGIHGLEPLQSNLRG